MHNALYEPITTTNTITTTTTVYMASWPLKDQPDSYTIEQYI